MLKGFEYNKVCRRVVDRSVYAQEHKILSDFLASDNENVRLEYANEREAKNAFQSLKKHIEQNRQPLKVAQRKYFVFAIKKIEDK